MDAFGACDVQWAACGAEKGRAGAEWRWGERRGAYRVLKVLEEAGIPIDYIAGTSMGSIVGGLYAIGYDARCLDSLVRVQNWPFFAQQQGVPLRFAFFGEGEG